MIIQDCYCADVRIPIRPEGAVQPVIRLRSADVVTNGCDCYAVVPEHGRVDIGIERIRLQRRIVVNHQQGRGASLARGFQLVGVLKLFAKAIGQDRPDGSPRVMALTSSVCLIRSISCFTSQTTRFPASSISKSGVGCSPHGTASQPIPRERQNCRKSSSEFVTKLYRFYESSSDDSSTLEWTPRHSAITWTISRR